MALAPQQRYRKAGLELKEPPSTSKYLLPWFGNL
jgi:hypothetical protein